MSCHILSHVEPSGLNTTSVGKVPHGIPLATSPILINDEEKDIGNLADDVSAI